MEDKMELRRIRFEKAFALERKNILSKHELMFLTDDDVNKTYEKYANYLKPIEYKSGFSQLINRLKEIAIVDMDEIAIKSDEEIVLRAAHAIMQRYK